MKKVVDFDSKSLCLCFRLSIVFHSFLILFVCFFQASRDRIERLTRKKMQMMKEPRNLDRLQTDPQKKEQLMFFEIQRTKMMTLMSTLKKEEVKQVCGGGFQVFQLHLDHRFRRLHRR